MVETKELYAYLNSGAEPYTKFIEKCTETKQGRELLYRQILNVLICFQINGVQLNLNLTSRLLTILYDEHSNEPSCRLYELSLIELLESVLHCPSEQFDNVVISKSDMEAADPITLSRYFLVTKSPLELGDLYIELSRKACTFLIEGDYVAGAAVIGSLIKARKSQAYENKSVTNFILDAQKFLTETLSETLSPRLRWETRLLGLM